MKHMEWDSARREGEWTAPHEDGMYACRTEVRRTHMLEAPVGWVSYTDFKGRRVEAALLLRHWEGGSLSIMEPDGNTVAVMASMLTDVEILIWEKS